MSAASDLTAVPPHSDITMAADVREEPKVVVKNYKGFVAGVFSGIAKLTVGHPFDTIKVRLQTTDASRFSGPLQCVTQTLRNEGVPGLYKGATPPLVGWMFMDSVMLGSLTVYRRLLAESLFRVGSVENLPSYGHGIAGMMAGSTVSFIAAPVEHVKARLQIQYAANKTERLYSGPVDCLRKIYAHHGVKGVYHGLSATLLFRGFFFCWWGSYDVFSRYFRENTKLSAPAVNFWAGGLSAQVFWLTSYPSDVIKQRIMTDPLGGGLNDGVQRFPRWRDAATAVYREAGWKGYWRGFLPCFLRAFPANAMALVAFEGVMRALPE
ncbi:Putative mitochondrial carrier protein [Colletotrichum destructivum]|uniref:Mitochondrial carrier protein n=1 Tax=Colletotrichum destructivum TaxID=34406 RepID=A0AAX4IZE5_9PEZI|nr:Putative mitochondrial carrier protein [Colletotrichum destructivum]